MNLCPCPHESILELFKNIDLSGSFRGIGFPSAPVTVIVEIILSWAGLKNSVSGYGPGEFVFESGHYWIAKLIFQFKGSQINILHISNFKVKMNPYTTNIFDKLGL
jgi:hypothetical protein